MNDDLKGKTALVTGASRGIGAAIARTLAGQGALVAVHCASRRDDADRVVQEIEQAGGAAFTLQADLSRHAEVAGLFNQLDMELTARAGGAGLDILVNNAGLVGVAGLMETTEAEYDALMNLNLKGLFFVTQQASPRLRNEGRVINITSLSARGAAPRMSVYAAAKLAANSFTQSMAAEFAARRITVNAVAPGAVATEMIADQRSNPGFDEAVIAATAFRRLGEPQDIADAVLLLVVPGASWITGQIIEVSGGLRL